jgi:hypothetical protein
MADGTDGKAREEDGLKEVSERPMHPRAAILKANAATNYARSSTKNG